MFAALDQGQPTGDEAKTEKVAAIERALKKYKIRQKFRRLAELDGFFGRRHLYVDTGQTADRDLLKAPLIPDRKLFEPGTLRGFRVIESSACSSDAGHRA